MFDFIPSQVSPFNFVIGLFSCLLVLGTIVGLAIVSAFKYLEKSEREDI